MLTVAGLYERAEQALLVKGADTAAAVLDTHTDRETLRRRGHDSQAQADLAFVGELDGIAQQIGQHLLESRGIDQHIAVAVLVQFDPPLQVLLPGQAFKDPAHRQHQRLQIGSLRRQRQVPGLDTGNVQDVADQGKQLLPGI
ncbi:hypothetical protein D3C81_1568170 [compost metagenome]